MKKQHGNMDQYKTEMEEQKKTMPISQKMTYNSQNAQQHTPKKANSSILSTGTLIPTLNKPKTPVKPVATSTTANTSKTSPFKANKATSHYQQALKPLVFEFLADLPNSLIGVGSSPTTANKRIIKEMSIFKEVLPCQTSNAIFVRVSNTKMYSMNALISGSTDTPYANGLYHFQVFCDYFFPVSPPKMQLLTGKGKVRFNPNLYKNGYICLSLLGTWKGEDNCQFWCPVNSNLNQIFLSIQSLIMSDNIYFNEPGYQEMKGTVKGEKYNRGYSMVVKLANIRYAMIQMIKNPPKGFEEVVRKHFLLKKEEILQQCQEWLKEKDLPYLQPGFNQSQEEDIKTCGFGKLLEKEIEELKKAFATLKEQP